MSQFFTSGGQSIGVSASASVLPKNIQDRIPAWINSMDIEVWQTPVHGGTESDATERLSTAHISSIQLLVWLFATPWTAALQASLSITNSWSLLKLMFIMSVMPSNRLILCCPLLFQPSVFSSIRVFSKESVLHIRWPKIGASASASVLPMNIQCWFPLGLAALICLQSKGLW